MNHGIKGFLSLHVAAGRIREDGKKGQKVSVCRHRGGGWGGGGRGCANNSGIYIILVLQQTDSRQSAAIGTRFTL